MNVTISHRATPHPADAGGLGGGREREVPRAGDGTGRAAGRPGPVARVLLALIHSYQRWISPALAPRCRFYPSCSAYAVTAIERFGAGRGSLLAAWRLLKCQPFHPGGIDHVPTRPGRE
jgi:putative membrane protein insertion efficiency factor